MSDELEDVMGRIVAKAWAELDAIHDRLEAENERPEPSRPPLFSKNERLIDQAEFVAGYLKPSSPVDGAMVVRGGKPLTELVAALKEAEANAHA